MKLLLIDGNSIINRAFFAVKGLSTKEGFSTNAIFGFYNTLEKILKEDEFTHVVAAFDLKKPTFRHEKFEGYKAKRKKMPIELFLQLKETKRMLSLLGVKICEVEGFEADDVLGTLSRIFSEKKIKTVIATGDRDCLQLVDENVVVRLSTNKEAVYYDEQKIFEKYGLKPKDLIEVKALMGDASDNIPGVAGIGEKTALKLVLKYKTVEKIFSDVASLDETQRVKNLLLKPEAEKSCFLSKFLGTICREVPLSCEIKKYQRTEILVEELIDFFKEFELNKILNSFVKENESASLKKKLDNFKVSKNPKIIYVLNKVENLSYLDFYLDENLYIFCENEIFEFFGDLKKEAFLEIVVKSKKKKRTTNLKEVYGYCYREDFNITNVVFSCDLAAYLIDVSEENFDISNIASRYCGIYQMPQSFLEVLDKLEREIERLNLKFVLEEIEMPICRILAEMEHVGVEIDLKELEAFGKFLEGEIERLKVEIFEECGESFNLNSTKELSHILFEKLGLKKGKKTKTGYSTDINVLEKLVKFHPVVAKIVDYRSKQKLLSTYVVGLKKLVKEDVRLHSHFNQTKTKTGRISSTNPNLQNIPVKTELGARMRKFLKAKEGSMLIDADYSQIELRILASLSGDEKMVETFKNGGDIHSLTAEKIFGFVNKETRSRAKIINFSVIYGVSAFSLAKDIGVSVASAKKYIDSFFENYDGVREYFEKTLKIAQEEGEVKTLFNRVRKIPELRSKNKNILELGKRIAKNTPIQGTAADVIKIAMIKISNRLKEEGLFAKIILQVHDEILVEVLKKDVEIVAKIVKEGMEEAVSLKVPLVCNVGLGRTWFEAKE